MNFFFASGFFLSGCKKGRGAFSLTYSCRDILPLADDDFSKVSTSVQARKHHSFFVPGLKVRDAIGVPVRISGAAGSEFGGGGGFFAGVWGAGARKIFQKRVFFKFQPLFDSQKLAFCFGHNSRDRFDVSTFFLFLCKICQKMSMFG